MLSFASAFTTEQLEAKTLDELKKMTADMAREADTLTAEQENLEKEIKAKNQEIQDKLKSSDLDVSKIQNTAKERTDNLEKKRRIEKKILSLYARFPSILEAKQQTFVSTDVKVLAGQLENIDVRIRAAKKEIAERSL
jgi:predicted oxidoreductase